MRAGRDPQAAAAALEAVRDAAARGQNVMPAMMEAVRARAAAATLGEITQALKQVFGVFREPVRL